MDRRRWSDNANVKGDGSEMEIYSFPSSSDDNDDEHTPIKSKPQRRGDNSESEAEEEDQPSTRSSGRQRKAPRRYEDDLVVDSPTTRKRKKKMMPTPKVEIRAKTGGGREVKDKRKESEKGNRGKKISKAATRVSMRKNRGSSSRATATATATERTTNDQLNNAEATNNNDEDNTEAEPATTNKEEEEDDDMNNLVSIQLQQDTVVHHGPDDRRRTLLLLPDYAERFREVYSKEGLEEETRVLTKAILDKLTGKRRMALKGLDNEYRKVHQLVEQTVTAGQGNSMLVFGSRGSGKSTVVETVISSLAQQHRDDFHVVRLNGFLHTDDRLALREMWRQLGRETEMETTEDTAKITSYADTMATLLALLSHPEEVFGESGRAETAKSVVIVLDEFDLFASHPRQTLLYNLFDIAQARKAPVAVIGLTTRIDVTEVLEKRVKSRFSHRYTFLPRPRSFEAFRDVCLAGLDLDLDLELEEEEDHHQFSDRWNRLLREWRQYLNGLWNDEEFQKHAWGIYYRTRSVKEFFTSAIVPMAELHQSIDHDDVLHVPKPADFISQSLFCPDPASLPFVAGSSPSLPLALLLAATRLTALYDDGNYALMTLSFSAAYAEYVRLLTSAKRSASVSGAVATPGRIWGREVSREAWEKLVTWGLVVPVRRSSAGAVEDGRVFRVEVSFEEAATMMMGGTSGSLGKWWRYG